jgi:UBA-like domain
VLKKKEERDIEVSATLNGSREELERATLIKMKSVTKASEDVCISILESNGYNLKSSVETYLLSR